MKLNKKQIKIVVYDFTSEQLGVHPNKIKDRSKLIDDLGADSLDIMEMVMAAEERFDIDIPDKDVNKMRTVGDIINYVAKKNITSKQYSNFKVYAKMRKMS